jgi:hypothetical protein
MTFSPASPHALADQPIAAAPLRLTLALALA